MKKLTKKSRKRSNFLFTKKNILKIVILLLFSSELFISAQSLLDLNKEKLYKLEINQFDYSVLNSYPQTVIDIKNKKNKAIIKIKTEGTLNKYNSMSSNTDLNIFFSDSEKRYLQSSYLIDFNDKNIKLIYDKLQLSRLSEFQCAKTIINFLTAVIKYDSLLAAEIGAGLNYGKSASWVLENKKGTCGEYTNLFIALMRLRGIPSKFVTGLYYSRQEVSFHAWAEFYDKEKGWVAVDPQGGMLGITSNHIKLMEGIDLKDTNFDMANCNFKIKDITK